MSLEDLAIRAALKPFQNELDRQKDICSAMKAERDAALGSLDVALEGHGRGMAEQYEKCAAMRSERDDARNEADALKTQHSARHDEITNLGNEVDGLRDELAGLRAKGAAMATALERMADPRNWGPDGGWDGPSYPDEIARVALAAWRTP